jgi:S-DNA-T family DNA segregation ATPase FtsK/SpoIIIE
VPKDLDGTEKQCKKLILICYNIIFEIKERFVRSLIIIVGIVLFYGGFSTVFHDTTLSGNLGKQFGEGNIRWFGYLAYVDLFILFYPLYRLYRNPMLLRRLDLYAGWLVFFVSLNVFQPLVVEIEQSGVIGQTIYTTLLPFIGQAGLWLFWLMTLLLAFVLIVDDDYDFAPLFARLAFWKHRVPRSERTAKKSTAKQRRQIVSINSFFSRIRSFFHNPFDMERKHEIDRILNMQLDPIEVRDHFAMEDEERVPQLDNHTTAEIEEEWFGGDTPLDAEKAELEPTSRSTPRRPRKKVIKNHDVEIVEELEENSKILADIEKGTVAKPKNFKLPKIDFLQKAPKAKKKINEAEIDRKIEDLLSKLQQFKVEGDVVRTYSGPLVTTFEFKPAPNVKVSKILGLQDDLAMALAAKTIRIQAPIPGRDVVGIEIPNADIDTIYLREILESEVFKESSSPLTVALGKDIVGKPFVTDIRKLPHLLVAGTTGSGKSVGINAMILSLLYRNDPDQLKLMLIDPKMLEFSMYNDIPHLITPVIIEPAKAIAALANMVGEMERRYKLMADSRTKNIENYNDKVKREASAEPFPYIVVVIDELADLMMNGGKEVELSIARLAQKSRACGIHLVVATQRPSVDVVTGLIKANLPSRLSYRVGQRIDSKVILDQMGAESLLGRGDGLFTPPGSTGLVRIHAPWSTEEEIDTIVDFLKAQRLPEYDESYLVAGGAAGGGEEGEGQIDLDPLFEQAKEIVLNDKKTSISYLQRKLQIGYNRSANIIEQLEHMSVLSAPNAKGNREIL